MGQASKLDHELRFFDNHPTDILTPWAMLTYNDTHSCDDLNYKK